MTFNFIGYFPKKIERAITEMGLPAVSEIWSVSNCISPGPTDWIQHWRRNDCGFFDTVELARSVVPDALIHEFHIVAYRLWSEAFGDGPVLPFIARASAIGIPERFAVIGYDAVSSNSGLDFECSPLSCNGAAKDFVANDRCLFASSDEAVAAAKTFAAGTWEPGPYYVVEVLVDTGRA